MKRVLLRGNATHHAIVDDDDFEVVNAAAWYWRNGYAHAPGLGSMHRFLIHPPHDRFVDHRNRDRLDNRRSNLRICTPAQNSANDRRPTSHKYVGVTRGRAGFYRTALRGKDLGLFPSAEDAARAYNQAALDAYGDFACLNEVA